MMTAGTTRLSFLTITVLAALVISGCSLTPDYQRPATPVPPEWNQQDVSLSENDAVHSSGPYFSDDRLQQLIRLAIAGNKDLRVSALNLKKAGEQYGIVRLSHLPNIGLSVGKTAAHEPAGIFDTIDTGAVTYHQYDVKLVSASWEIDFWGRLRSLKEASLNEYLAADASSRALKINLIEQTVSAYFNYLASRETVEIASQVLENTLTHKAMLHKARQAGALSMDEVIDADREADRAQTSLAQLKLQAQQDYNALQLLVGAPLPPSLFNGVSLDQDWRFPSLKSGLPSDVLLKRPDIVAAEYELKAANAQIGAARAAFFPSVSITAEGGSSSAQLSNLLSGGTANWSFVPSVNLPIFDGGKNEASLNVAELNKQVEIVNYQKAIQQAFREVSDALAGQASMRIQYKKSQEIYDAVCIQYQMAKATHDAGQISKETLLQKNNTFLDLQKQKLDTRLRYLVQSVKLFSVLGGDNSI